MRWHGLILASFLVCAAVVCTIENPSIAQDAKPTLEELKRSGASRSRYRNFKTSAVGTAVPKPRLDEFRKHIGPVLARTCVSCHGPKKQEGNIRIDNLDPNLLTGKDVNWWLEIAAVLNKGEMPPADAPALADEDRGRIIEWLSTEIQLASAVRRATSGHSSFRRMTSYEYNHALQDLLGLPYNFAKDLPPEAASEDGFLNSSEHLQMSVAQFSTFRELGRNALRLATVRGDRPKPLHWSVSMKAASADSWKKHAAALAKIRKQHKDNPEKLKQALKRQEDRHRARHGGPHYKDLAAGTTARVSWGYPGARYAWKPVDTMPPTPPVSQQVAIIPARQKLIVELGDRAPDTGTLRVRVRAWHIPIASDRHPSLQVEFGWQASNDSHASVKISQRDTPIDATADKPRFYQWDFPVSEIYPRNLVRGINKLGDLPNPSEFIKLVNSSASPGDIVVDQIEVSGPVYDQWPPASHTRIFSGVANDAERASESERARGVLERFMTRAWRRRPTKREVDQKLALFARLRPQCDDFQEAIIEVLATVIASPKFLYLAPPTRLETPGQAGDAKRLSASDLATRLSMFLWCSIPDRELRELAAAGRLDDRKVVAGQVKRMLADPRSQRFSRQFVRQWLGMQLLDFVKIDRKVHRQFDPTLKQALQQEPITFFHDVLQRDRSVLDFLHADYTMVNERLARHYGIDGVWGNDFRRVSLQPQHNRGGLLTQAGLLAMNSDGKDSHPLKRGIWMLKSLLNDPPPPPPPAVPEIDVADPRVAKMTLKERIEDHRNHAACMSCHAKIDPWGIAFENYDAVGLFRTAIGDKPVDASSQLFNKQPLEGMDGLKRYLLTHRQDQFTRAMVHKMMTYALGRPLGFGDRSSVDQVTADLRKQGDGLATMITLIATSELFQSK